MRTRPISTFATYVVAQLPGWILAGAAAWALVRWWGLGMGIAVLGLAAWVLKDLVLYRWARRFYEPEPSNAGMIDARGTAVTDLRPRGFVRVHGELWEAQSERAGLDAGSPVRVRALRGLVLRVTGDGEPRAAKPSRAAGGAGIDAPGDDPR